MVHGSAQLQHERQTCIHPFQSQQKDLNSLLIQHTTKTLRKHSLPRTLQKGTEDIRDVQPAQQLRGELRLLIQALKLLQFRLHNNWGAQYAPFGQYLQEACATESGSAFR